MTFSEYRKELQVSAHTPGPWAADGVEVWGTHALRFSLTAAGTPRIAICDSHLGAEQPFPAEANARLISAAPELLAALQAIVQAVANGRAAITHPLVDAASAALRKATGSAA